MSLMLRQAGVLDDKPQGGAAATAKARELLQPASTKKGTIAVPKFQYELEPTRHRYKILVSLFFHVALVFLLIQISPWIRRETFEALDLTRKMELVAPTISEERPPEIKIKPITPPVVRTPQEIIVPRNIHIEQKPDVPVAPVTPVIKTNVLTPMLPAEKKVEVAVKKEVVVNTFQEAGSSQQSVIKKPAAQVQTGGFGDPQGVNGVSKRNAALNVASVGSFDAPAGPGKGNGTAGNRGTAAVVNSTGFGNGTAGRGTGDQRKGGTVSNTGFGTLTPTTATTPRRTQVAANTTPVQIDYKPRPVYTEDARSHHIEGEVVLEVLFGTTGDLKVQRVVRGLGYGLDEAAVKAASQIRFRPAMQSGQPYASTALVHIVFELAQ